MYSAVIRMMKWNRLRRWRLRKPKTFGRRNPLLNRTKSNWRQFVIASLLGALIGSTLIQGARADIVPLMTASGPGARIFGLDISRYQHTKNQPINFPAMYAAGVRFLWINGGNTLVTPDLVASAYYFIDRSGAQNQGIYTGFYYYAHLPNTTVKTTIIANANNQANKVAKRIQDQGGLNSLDLPVALDLETNCTSLTSKGVCRRSMSKTNVTLWAKTFMQRIEATTGRPPFFYSYIGFINAHIALDPVLVSYPLWISTAKIDPSKPENQPTLKSGRCPTSPWIDSRCSVNWQFWQYTGVGAGAHYGLQSGPVDLNVFKGSAEDFLKLVNGNTVIGTPVPIPTPDTSTVTSE